MCAPYCIRRNVSIVSCLIEHSGLFHIFYVGCSYLSPWGEDSIFRLDFSVRIRCFKALPGGSVLQKLRERDSVLNLVMSLWILTPEVVLDENIQKTICSWLLFICTTIIDSTSFYGGSLRTGCTFNIKPNVAPSTPPPHHPTGWGEGSWPASSHLGGN